jgi:CBS domain-containing protein
MTRVQEIMTREPQRCRKGTMLNEVARIMWERDCGFVPVVDQDDHVVGAITDRDVCMAAYTQGGALADILVDLAMAEPAFCCRASEDVEHAERIMREHRIRRLPVIDDHGRLAGVISLNDLARRGPDDGAVAKTLAAVCAPRAHAIAAQ